MKIAVCLPTRGIIDTLTIESIIKNLDDYDHKFYFTHDLPLPNSRIDITDRALADKCDFLWWVDDDMVIPDGFLKKLLEVADEKTIACGAYYMQNGQKSVFYFKKEAKQCGFGCSLIHRNIYKNTPQPWYRTNKVQIWNGTTPSWMDDPNSTWGGEDIWFYYQAIDVAGFKLKEVGDVGHLRIHTWGNKYLNNGVHDIYELGPEGQRDFTCPDYDPKEFIDGVIERMKDEV